MEHYIRKQVNTLEALTSDDDNPDYDPIEVGEHLRQLLHDVELMAATEGFPEVVEACQMREGPIGAKLARLILSRCLSLVKEEPSHDWLIVSEVADVLRVSDSKVLDWINTGRLQAKNLSDSNRPQYRIHIDNLKELDGTTPEAKPRRRKSSQSKDYFS